MSDFVVRPIPIAATRALRRQVLRPHQSLEEVAAGEPASGYAIGAFAAGRLIATGIIGPGDDPGVWRVRGMATEPAARGRGAGSQVLDALLRHASGRGATRVWCQARTPALSLYERAGFRRVSAEFEVPRIGPHVRMELAISASLPREGSDPGVRARRS